MKAQQLLSKIIIVGDTGVGKTNILIRFCQNQFKPNYIATIGVDFKIKSVQVGNTRLKMQIWDTAGQERYRTITQTYYKGASGIILTYSITNEKSFASVESWITQIRQHSASDVVKILVANKSDCEQQRKVQTLQGKVLANKYNMPFFQVSAKTGQGIAQMFNELARHIVTVSKPTNGEGKLELNQNRLNKPAKCQC